MYYFRRLEGQKDSQKQKSLLNRVGFKNYLTMIKPSGSTVKSGFSAIVPSSLI